METHTSHESLFSQLTSPDCLLAAWEKVRQNQGCAGVDGETVDCFAGYADTALRILRQSLVENFYRPQPLLSIPIPKRDGSRRMLAVPTVRDRIVQTAAAHTLAPLLDAEFDHCSYAYREGRSSHLATAVICRYRDEGYRYVVDADIRGYFDNIPHGLLLERLSLVVAEPVILQLILDWLHAEVSGANGPWCLCRGIPQGSPISPWLANLYLDEMDDALLRQGYRVVRYADDFVVLTESRDEAEIAFECIRAILDRLKLELNLEKSRITDFDTGFNFLGTRFQGKDMVVLRPQELSPETAVLTKSRIEPIESSKPHALEPVPLEGGITTGSRQPRLRSLYILDNGSELCKDGQRIVVRRQGVVQVDIPSEKVDAILLFGAASITTPLMDMCLERRIPIYLLNTRGRHFGMLDSFSTNHVITHRQQFERNADPDFCLSTAKAMIHGKLANSRLLLRRHGRTHDYPELNQIEIEIEGYQHDIAAATDLNTLRGIEGVSARAYFHALTMLIPSEWGFTGRRKRPPPDPVNAMLSFSYTLLFYNIHALLCSAGLNPAVGFLHAMRPGHQALASDMIEEFRAPVVDALVLSLISRHRIRPDEFNPPAEPGEPCLLIPDARKRFIHAFEAKMSDQVTLRDGSRMDYRRLMEGQVHSLVAAIRGSVSSYAPYRGR